MFTNHFTNTKVEKLDHGKPTEGVFFTPNGYTGARKKDTNLTHVNAVWADWDFKPVSVTGDNKPDFKQFMLDLDGLPEPTYIVESGNGWHLYWLLDTPIVVDDSNRDEMIKLVEGVHRFIHEHYHSDSGAMDALRLMRLPGHEHRKQPEHPFMVEVVEESDTRYTWDEILEAMPPLYKEVVQHEPSDTEDYDIKQVAIDVWKEKGAEVTFDTLGRMIWNGESTGTFANRDGGNYIATTSDDFPAKGNPTTYVAGVLGVTNKEAYKWLIKQYGELEKVQEIVRVTECPERDDYLEHLAEKDWENDDWVKKLKMLSNRYFINFYKQVAVLYPHLRYEIGRVDTFWDYNEADGTYFEIAQSTLAGMIIRALRDDEMDVYTTDSQVRRIVLNFTAYPERGVKLDSFSLPSGWLHVANGWLELPSKTLHPHTPERLSLSKMETEYDPNATCPLYDKFLDTDTQMAADQVRVIDQFSGYILTDSIEQHKCLILEGRKGSGKSMLMEIWMNMLGDKAVPLQLTALQGGGERFIGQTLAHKNLCWFDEANPRTSNINEFFQNLITGERIGIERKGIQGNEYVRNTMKVVLSLNEMPDHMPVGMDRRFRHIVFTRSFYEEGMVDPQYKQKVLAKEKSGILNRMIRGLDDLNKMGLMTTIGGEEERKREYALTADDFSSFLSDHFDPTPVDEGIIRYSYKQLRDAFVAEYPKSYNKQLTVRGFNKKLLSTRLPEYKYTKTDKSGSTRGYKGIKLKVGHEMPTEDYKPIMTTAEVEQNDNW